MNLLAIETTGAKASAALADSDGNLVVQSSEETMNHLQHLIPMIEELLSKCGKLIDDVSVIAISEGPGSFTGIRIGMATAKALAQVLNIAVVSVPTLESFAYHIPDYRGMVCPIFDARRNQVYAGAYLTDGKGNCHQLMEDGAYDLTVYLEKLAQAAEKAERLIGAGSADAAGTLEAMLFGDGIAPYGETIRKTVADWKTNGSIVSLKGDLCLKSADESMRYQSAASVARLGCRLLEEGKAKSLSEIHPVYLRQAEAQRKLEEAAGKQHG